MQFRVTAEQVKGIAQVSILNASGKVVYWQPDVSVAGIRISGLPPGMYVINIIKNNGGLQTGKIEIAR